MNSDPLFSCRIKIDRAKKHLNDLKDAIKGLRYRHTYEFFADEETEPAVKIYRVRILEDIPIDWSGYIGDTIHNTRSALDCLAVELALRTNPMIGNEALREIYFPIAWDIAGLSNTRRTRFFELIGADAEKLIREVEPYRRGKGHVLWQLEHLDIADKHRRIVPAFRRIDHMVFTMLPPEDGSPVNIPYYKPPFPLKDGDEICRIAFFEAHFDASVYFHLEIALDESPFCEGEPVVPTLEQFIDFTERLIDIFRRNIFR